MADIGTFSVQKDEPQNLILEGFYLALCNYWHFYFQKFLLHCFSIAL